MRAKMPAEARGVGFLQDGVLSSCESQDVMWARDLTQLRTNPIQSKVCFNHCSLQTYFSGLYSFFCMVKTSLWVLPVHRHSSMRAYFQVLDENVQLGPGHPWDVREIQCLPPYISWSYEPSVSVFFQNFPKNRGTRTYSFYPALLILRTRELTARHDN